MTRIPPIPDDQLPDTAAIRRVEANFGFVPNSIRTLAYQPTLLEGALRLAAAIEEGGVVDRGLKRLVAHAGSLAAGCRYCAEHTSDFAIKQIGIEPAKLAAVIDYEDSDQFSEAERAAIRVGWAAGRVPNEVTDEMISELRRHFNDAACAEIIGAVAVYGFFNRWNDTLKTKIEPEVLGVSATQQPAAEPSKHAKTHRGSGK